METTHVIGIAQCVVGAAFLSMAVLIFIIRQKRGDYTEIIFASFIIAFVNLLIGFAAIL